MDNFVDWVVNRIVMNISPVRALAAAHGGQCTWHFSQAKDPVRTLIGSSSKTKAGICEILAAKWMCERHNGRSLETWITVGGVGGNRRNLDRSKLALLAMTFGTGIERDDDEVQREHTENWMRTQGVVPRRGRAWLRDEGFNGDVADGMVGDLQQHAAPYRALITVHGTTAFTGEQGHIMALDVGATIAYFDPNFGEFTFPTFGAFSAWFIAYYAKSRYGWVMNQSYKVQYF